ncbi:hypothetical protein ACN4EW_07520 [Arthrospira platensis CENA650]
MYQIRLVMSSIFDKFTLAIALHIFINLINQLSLNTNNRLHPE